MLNFSFQGHDPLLRLLEVTSEDGFMAPKVLSATLTKMRKIQYVDNTGLFSTSSYELSIYAGDHPSRYLYLLAREDK